MMLHLMMKKAKILWFKFFLFRNPEYDSPLNCVFHTASICVCVHSHNLCINVRVVFKLIKKYIVKLKFFVYITKTLEIYNSKSDLSFFQLNNFQN